MCVCGVWIRSTLRVAGVGVHEAIKRLMCFFRLGQLVLQNIIMRTLSNCARVVFYSKDGITWSHSNRFYHYHKTHTRQHTNTHTHSHTTHTLSSSALITNAAHIINRVPLYITRTFRHLANRALSCTSTILILLNYISGIQWRWWRWWWWYCGRPCCLLCCGPNVTKRSTGDRRTDQQRSRITLNGGSRRWEGWEGVVGTTALAHGKGTGTRK